jgi:hypothetical protein
MVKMVRTIDIGNNKISTILTLYNQPPRSKKKSEPLGHTIFGLKALSVTWA